MKTFWVSGRCYIEKIRRHVFFNYPVSASTASQARYYVCLDLQQYFATSEVLQPELDENVGMHSKMNHLRGTKFKVYEDKAKTAELDRDGKRLNDPIPRIKKQPRRKGDLPF